MSSIFGNKSVSLLSACCIALASLATPARAALTYSVNSTLDQLDDDPGDGVCHTVANTCTLRAAVMEVNRLAAPALITILLPAGTYTLALPVTGSDDEFNGDLDLAPPAVGSPVIVLQGAGASTTIIDANHIDRVLEIHPGRSAIFNALTIRNGLKTTNGGGIAVQSNGSLEINDAMVTGNTLAGSSLSERRGGGAWIRGVLKIRRSDMRMNSAYDGGGIFVESTGSVSIANSNLATNASTFGGAMSIDGAAIIAQSALTGNTAYYGGGVFIGGSFGSLVMINGTVAGNSALTSGGGFYVTGSSISNIYNTTIAFNDADGNEDNEGSGGGVYVEEFGGNTPVFNFRNTIIAGNSRGLFGFVDDCDGVANSYGHNRLGTTNGCTITTVNGNWTLLNGLTNLGPLQDNGGPTPTIALQSGSNAINTATLGCVDQNSMTLPTDQRGFSRNVGICDIGAFEYGAVADSIFESGFD